MMTTTLRKIVSDLIDEVVVKNGKSAHHMLPNGLKISLRRDKENHFILMFSRLEDYPSLTEWFAVVESFPKDMTWNIEGRKQKYKRWYSYIVEML